MAFGLFSLTTTYMLLMGRRAATQQSLGAALFTSMASSSSSGGDHRSLQSYYQLVVDKDGGTSMLQREFTNVEEKGYSNTPQLLKQLDEAFATPTNLVFTQLMGDNPWHHCPAPQIVICTGGGWFIKTTDGQRTELRVGDILYQDNTEQHPAAKEGTHKAMHFSGSLDGKPCDQVIVQLDLKNGPIVDSKHSPPPL